MMEIKSNRSIIFLILYFIVLWASMSGLHMYEKRHPKIVKEDLSITTYNMVRFLYPWTLGLWEMQSWASLKILSNLSYLAFEGSTSEMSHPLALINIGLFVLQMIAVSVYLFKTYSRFSPLECFPIEYANVAVLVIINGMIFFAEYKNIETTIQGLM